MEGQLFTLNEDEFLCKCSLVYPNSVAGSTFTMSGGGAHTDCTSILLPKMGGRKKTVLL